MRSNFALSLAALLSICFNSVAFADGLDTDRFKIATLSEQQITDAVADWIRANGDGCSIIFSRESSNRMEDDVSATLFTMIGTEEENWSILRDTLDVKVDDVMDSAMENGVFKVDFRGETAFVTIDKCEE